jgi:hypothetical protein
MATSRILAVAIAALSLPACTSQAPGADAAALDQKCAEISSTGDMYRYCLQQGPEQVVLTSRRSNDVAASVSPPP